MIEKQPQMPCWAQAERKAPTSGPSSRHMSPGSVLIERPCSEYSGNTTRSIAGTFRRALPTSSTIRVVWAASSVGVVTVGSCSWTNPTTTPDGDLLRPPSPLIRLDVTTGRMKLLFRSGEIFVNGGQGGRRSGAALGSRDEKVQSLDTRDQRRRLDPQQRRRASRAVDPAVAPLDGAREVLSFAAPYFQVGADALCVARRAGGPSALERWHGGGAGRADRHPPGRHLRRRKL